MDASITRIQKKGQEGFSLLELMIALVLGLLISAAAIQVFLLNQKSVSNQQSLMNIQNSAIFGLDSVVRDVRLANLRSSQPYIDDKILYSGIVLSPTNLSAHYSGVGAAQQLDFTIDEKLLSRSEIGLSNLKDKKSDQLVIQYKVTVPNQFDCEGKGLAVDTYVVQRYFLREDNKKNNDPNKALVLACKATSYTETDSTTNKSLVGLDGNGEIIIPRVDHFSVLLEVANDGMNSSCSNKTTVSSEDGRLDCFSYMTIADYLKITVDPKPQIVAVKIGMLVRATDSSGQDGFFKDTDTFEVLQTKGALTVDEKNKLYLRKTVTQTIALRNGFGIEN
ncbi:PilW family protein [Acinetobacter wuhouensis]|uniref:Prepilin-type N-terminal cleavage/methylation domain-containing protein n=1 Tax=Acinetobacter wuhouensis TaxID=1879050 RepID=A0A3G2T738_9GAMM|nr:PilW family protein [Acinetobacter wuhouensis]AYO55815.1 prepilin-type N-terminal cleavage/methylation domain-containing protein [Acinetobacter wuhouensis]